MEEDKEAEPEPRQHNSVANSDKQPTHCSRERVKPGPWQKAAQTEGLYTDDSCNKQIISSLEMTRILLFGHSTAAFE